MCKQTKFKLCLETNTNMCLQYKSVNHIFQESTVYFSFSHLAALDRLNTNQARCARHLKDIDRTTVFHRLVALTRFVSNLPGLFLIQCSVYFKHRLDTFLYAIVKTISCHQMCVAHSFICLYFKWLW